MVGQFDSLPEIKKQLDQTRKTILDFSREVESDDLVRYPNVDEHLPQLTEAIDAGWSALESIQDKNIQKAPDIAPLVEVTSNAIFLIKSKSSQEKTSALVAALAALQGFQEGLNEIDFDEQTRRDQIRVEKTDTDNRSSQ